ncbi:unnamed protein product [Adineta steineri]|uniref:Uncharacterized protein n=1 Tax=Adineta steineri TaxID=433720 RepID=A0A819S305_9BILA|nr:unnamed protein product [Adineta steineri]CAF1105481.1 unnamed protein product [Adineta steineri]CAF4055010.1 unnamed protein product [Adineta steineri]CAF4197337.1 unnamed protein product [Adineta steineri]
MSSMIRTIIIILLVSILSIVNCDYLCNCYCSTGNSYVVHSIYVSSSSICNAQTCENTCTGLLSSYTSGSVRNSHPSIENDLTMSLDSLVMGLAGIF